VIEVPLAPPETEVLAALVGTVVPARRATIAVTEAIEATVVIARRAHR
jgi:hypothetical protein